jgi:hypothetical protein
MDETNKPQTDEIEADGYYGEDDMDDEELDLSFLDEDDDGDEAKEPAPGK